MSNGYGSSVIWIPPKTFICPSGKLRTEITSLLAKYTSPGLSDTTFFHGVEKYLFKRKEVKFSDTKKLNTLLKGKHFSNSFKLSMWKDKHMQWFITEAYSWWKTNLKQLFSQCLTYQKPPHHKSVTLNFHMWQQICVYQGRIQDVFQEGVHSSLALLQHQ